ncbi:MAG: carboxynorspermidine decarboxylase [Elusimicrobia bacterium RIFOXYC2_FULL_34_12]|nr:MAG: carboxynorspermidine decarboxylase [Elusimicrobia bacterium RIFOXYC2_FULL_34_12]OGS37932.1 MAG: carboxynorspermidine decarboxylase [Elusimicrobia bacterium RIFOXYD2_FULL_34_30]
MNLQTPYYLIDESKLLLNLKKIKYVRDYSGAKSVLALKCFSTWSVFPLMKEYMDGTTSSSSYEARLGYEKFGKEVHAYCVAFSQKDIEEIKKYANKIIFNSASQLKMFYNKVRNKKIGLRVNPKISYSHFDLADPARKYSRLGVVDKKSLLEISKLISGIMFHFNCENDDFKNFSHNLDFIGHNYGDLLKKLEWISLGGGIYFTKEGYPLNKFCKKLKEFSEIFQIQIYLEPGETTITRSTELVTTVIDIVHNEIDIAIVDGSTESHMLDLLIYRTPAKMDASASFNGKHKYMIAGRSCLAGDVFGTYNFKNKLKIGSTIKFSDAAGYTMVKKNWFNGLQMPSIVIKRLNGSLKLIRSFNYKDYINALS